MDIADLDCDDTSISLKQSAAACLDGEAMIAVPDGKSGWVVNGVETLTEREGTHSVLRVPLNHVVRSTD
jgi:hypothetical protein